MALSPVFVVLITIYNDGIIKNVTWYMDINGDQNRCLYWLYWQNIDSKDGEIEGSTASEKTNMII